MINNFCLRNLALISLLAFLFVSCGDKKADPNEGIEYETRYDSLNAEIKKDSDNPALYALRGEWRIEEGDDINAMADFNRAIGLDSLNDEWHIKKVDLLFKMKEFGRAKKYLDEVIYVVPGSVGVMLRTSRVYLWASDYQQCINWANAALAFDKYSSEAYYLKGMAHKSSGDTTRAVTSFRTAVEQDPNHYESYIQLGQLFALEGHELASAYFQNAINVKPESIEAIYALAMVYQKDGRIEKANKQYQRILEIDSANTMALYNLGYVKLILEEKVDSASYYFENVILLDPKNADAQYNLGYCYELQGNLDEALQRYRLVLQMVPDHLLGAKGVNRITGQ